MADGIGQERPLTIFERSQPGRRAYALPELDVPEADPGELIPPALLREEPPALPEVSEPELVRHYVTLSQRNFSIDSGFYPLGSCTMKYNPKVHEQVAALPGFAALHPLQEADGAQGALALLWQLERWVCELAGLPHATLQPAAGAHGEWTGLMLIRAYHDARGEKRGTIVIPDTAHGTNPASVTLAGYRPLAVRTGPGGGVDLDDLERKVDRDTAGLMLTNPNTLGVYDENIVEVARIFHDAGALLYYDGANLNAVMGVSRPGDMGFDIVHINTHKSFSTPHGGGGPGAGPVCCTDELERFLPVPRIVRDEGRFAWDHDRPESIGKVKGYWGNFGVLVRAYAYIRGLGAAGLRDASENAVLNANYLLSRLRDAYDVPFDRRCAHEFVLSARRQKRASGVRATDIAKRLMDYGFHPPTVYFPLLVEEALMVEPTETETRETLDRFADAMLRIAGEASELPDLLKEAPTRAPVHRLDEVRAVRRPVLRQPSPEPSPA
jgi:glycine dehydrogenase subunit 2